MRPIFIFSRITLVLLFSTLLIFDQNQQRKMLAQEDALTLVPSETLFPSAVPTGTATETPTLFPTQTFPATLTETPLPSETPTASETATALSEITLTATASLTDDISDTPAVPDLTFTTSPSEEATRTPTIETSPTDGATTTASATDPFTETATASATLPAFGAEPPLSLLFTDTFDTGSLDLWNLGSGWSLANHETGQALQATNSDEAATFVYNTLNDAVVQTGFVMNSGMIRLSSRQSDAGAYSAILALNGQLALYRNNQVVATAALAQITPGTWHTLRLSVINSVLRVSVDGIETIATSDPTGLPPGTFSIAGINNTQSLLVDDISLWVLTGDLPPTATPTRTTSSIVMEAPAPFSLALQSLAAIPPNTQIVFVAQRTGNDTEIYTLDPTNCVAGIDCPATQITFDIAAESYPALSTDGSKITFVSNRTGNDELYVVDTTGNNLTRLTYNGDLIMDPTWSPDGSKIAFVSQRDGVWKIYVLTRADCISGIDCPATVLSSATTTGDYTPAWSPDGTKIAYYSRVSNRTNLFVMNAAGGTNNQQVTDTTSTGITNTYPAWSPDGNWIAFQTTRYTNYGSEIIKLDYAGCTTPPSCPVTRLTTNPYDDEQASWSPDGSLIVYSAKYGSSQRHLTIMNADGTYPTRLTYSGVNNQNAKWGAVNSAYPPDTDRLFVDDFEQTVASSSLYDFKSWSASQTDFGDLFASSSAAIFGNYGLLANLDDNNSIYLTDNFETSVKRLRMSFFFDPNSISMANGDTHYIVGGTTYTYQVELRRFNNEYQLRAEIDNDTAGGWSYTNWFSITDAAHFIDFAWTAATAPGTNDGSLSFWIDNSLQQTITGIDNDTRSASVINIGAVSGVDSNTRGTYYFDDVEVRKVNGNGAFVPTATPIPTATITPSPTMTPTETATFTVTPTPAFCPSSLNTQSKGTDTLNSPCLELTPTPTITPPQAICTAIVKDRVGFNSIRLHSEPNTNSDVLGQIPELSTIQIIGKNSEWYYLNTQFGRGWMRGIDLQLNEDCSNTQIPPIDPTSGSYINAIFDYELPLPDGGWDAWNNAFSNCYADYTTANPPITAEQNWVNCSKVVYRAYYEAFISSNDASISQDKRGRARIPKVSDLLGVVFQGELKNVYNSGINSENNNNPSTQKNTRIALANNFWTVVYGALATDYCPANASRPHENQMTADQITGCYLVQVQSWYSKANEGSPTANDIHSLVTSDRFLDIALVSLETNIYWGCDGAHACNWGNYGYDDPQDDYKNILNSNPKHYLYCERIRSFAEGTGNINDLVKPSSPQNPSDSWTDYIFVLIAERSLGSTSTYQYLSYPSWVTAEASPEGVAEGKKYYRQQVEAESPLTEACPSTYQP